MFYLLFAIGSWPFWALIGIVALGVIASLEFESGSWAAALTIGAFLAVWLAGDFQPLQFLIHNWSNLLIGFGVYVLAGIGWSFGKWYFHCLRKLDRYREIKAEFMEDLGLKPSDAIPDDKVADLKQHLAYKSFTDELPLKAIKHKSLIILWMTYWPFSSLWTLINDPVKRLYRFIFSRISTGFQRISNHLFKDVHADFAALEELARKNKAAGRY